MSYQIVGRVRGKNQDGKNSGGLVILLKHNNGAEEEVSRVAFERKEGFYKDVPFDRQVDKVVATAQKAKEVHDKLMEEAGKLL